MSSVTPVNYKPPSAGVKTSSTPLAGVGRISLGAGRKAGEGRSAAGSLLQRPTEASVAHAGSSTGSMLGRGRKQPPKELTFKQQLLKKTLKESAMRPSGIMALHIKHGHFYDIDSGGT